MLIIAMITQKGGTGKTTLALNLAVAALLDGRNPLIIDVDMQVSACKWADRRGNDNPPHVINAQPARLANTIAEARRQAVDFIIIDTPAKSGDAGLAAARVSDLVIIPCRPQILDLETIESTKDILKLAGNPPAMAVLNAVPPVGHRRREDAGEFLKEYEIAICEQAISHRAIFGDATAMGQSAMEAEPDGKAAQEIREVYLQVLRFSGKQEQLTHGKATGKSQRAS
jgi:chromosome partitioning protein